MGHKKHSLARSNRLLLSHNLAYAEYEWNQVRPGYTTDKQGMVTKTKNSPSKFRHTGALLGIHASPMLSMRRLRLIFSSAVSIRSCASDRLAMRARMTGRQDAKTLLTCE